MTVVAVATAATDGREREEDQGRLNIHQGRDGANRNRICTPQVVTIAQGSGRTDIQADEMRENGIETEVTDGVIIGGTKMTDLLDATETCQMTGPEEVEVEIAMHSAGVGSGSEVRVHHQKRGNPLQI